MKRLKSAFFERPTLQVAEELLGKLLIYKQHQGIITETEAYTGADDPASHAFRGKTPRTQIMFGKAGSVYVYLIYGMYHCLNFVTEKEGIAGAVLIRGVKLLGPDGLHLDGPGKVCRHMGITRSEYGVDLCSSPEFQVRCLNQTIPFNTTPRIGIKQAVDKPWRFVAVI